MEGVTILETKDVDRLVNQLSKVEELIKGLQENNKPWMSLKEVCEYMGKGSTWVDLNKGVIGFTKAGGEIRFKRKDVDAYLESRYFKSK